MIPELKKFKLYHTVIYRGVTWIITMFHYSPGNNVIYIDLNRPGKGNRFKVVRIEQIKPLGYALIKPSAGGKFRYHTVSWNNEKLQSSEPLDDKAHVIRMAKKYFPSFHIVDKTK